MLRVAIQMDPIEGVNIEGDTSFLMMESGQARGHSMFVYGPPGNGKTVISQAIRGLLDGEIAVRRRAK